MTTEDRHSIARQVSYDMAEKMLNAYKNLIEADFNPLAKTKAYAIAWKIGCDATKQLRNAGFSDEEAIKIVMDTADAVEKAKHKLL